MDDAAFLDHVTERLAALPHVETVTIGGSRPQGTHHADSDWDLAVHYRGPFDPPDLRDLGWPGEVSPIGGWGGGIYNGGAWPEIDGRRTDVHHRDLDVLAHEIAEARAGRVHIEHLLGDGPVGPQRELPIQQPAHRGYRDARPVGVHTDTEAELPTRQARGERPP
jgi:hypothetical protein